MKKAIVLLFLLLQYNGVFGQKESMHVSTLSYELHTIDLVFDDNPFMVPNKEGWPVPIYSDYINIISVDTIPLTINSNCKDDNIVSFTLDLYKIKVSGEKLASDMNYRNAASKKLKEDTLVFYALKYLGAYYTLFGFYMPNINLYYREVGLCGMKSLSNQLIKNGILNKYQAKLFYKTFKNEKKCYPTKMGMPSELLKYYFLSKNIDKANSVLQPVEPYTPITIIE